MTEQIKLTDEWIEQAKGLLPMDSKTTIKFTPPVYRDWDDSVKPVFELHQLDKENDLIIREMMYTEIQQYSAKKPKKVTFKDIDTKNKEYMKVLHTAVVGWDTLYNYPSGKLTLYEFDGTLDKLMGIPERVLTELLQEVMNISGLLPDGA